MPLKPRKPCAWTGPGGCLVLTDRRFCPTHQTDASRVDAARRGTAAQRGYDATHRSWRANVLLRDCFCVDPDDRHPGVLVTATVADHVVALREWARDRIAAEQRLRTIVARITSTSLGPWSIENGQGLCVACHNAKTRRDQVSS